MVKIALLCIMILVTGGTGFLGSHLLAKLMQENVPVRALKRENSSLYQVKRVFAYYKIPHLFEKIDWVNGDLLDYGSLLEALKEVSHVFHTAATVSFQKKDKKKILKNNIKGTSNLVDACLVSNVARFCHVSSIAALGVTEDGSPIDETKEWKSKKSNSAYSIGKFYSELHAWRGFSEGMTGVVLVPSVIIGPENANTGISPLIDLIKKGLKYYPKGSNGFVDVRDVADLMIHLTLHTEITNEKFIVNAENITYKKLYEDISSSLNIHSSRKAMSYKRLCLFAFLNNSFTSRKKISKALVRLISTNYSYSNNKVRELANFSFKTVEESIKDVVNA